MSSDDPSKHLGRQSAAAKWFSELLTPLGSINAAHWRTPDLVREQRAAFIGS
jgi:hypothetical protein